MFRIVDRYSSFRQNASEQIYKMLFVWERTPNLKASPWLAWITTAVVLWGYRGRIARAVLAVSPLRLLKRRAANPTASQKIPSTIILKQRKRHSLAHLHKHKTASLRRVKRLYTGDGPHVPSAVSVIQAGPPQIHYRVTRSGRVYGKYANKVAIRNGSGIQESH
ncbi:PREDICTED: uncharacterized protein LOC106742454 [Dinoponera quadriceps]|uniref:Uncharacterized protein LOC106742454 n=1 Tax=Dinoponera quadriceps TaxID=609295 RepID=A0A6P3WY69_DINQU|nr:PREDICTED: uncharacterized protein LOC106742454 [Dinoponera quadriceps]